MPKSHHTRKGQVRKHVKRHEKNAMSRHAQHSVVVKSKKRVA